MKASRVLALSSNIAATTFAPVLADVIFRAVAWVGQPIGRVGVDSASCRRPSPTLLSMTLLPPLLQRSPLAASAAASGCSLGRRIAINSSSSSSSSSRRAFHQTTPAASARSDPYRILALDRKASKKQIKERFYEVHLSALFSFGPF